MLIWRVAKVDHYETHLPESGAHAPDSCVWSDIYNSMGTSEGSIILSRTGGPWSGYCVLLKSSQAEHLPGDIIGNHLSLTSLVTVTILARAARSREGHHPIASSTFKEDSVECRKEMCKGKRKVKRTMIVDKCAPCFDSHLSSI
jgi:hypothetical protein